jgi:hypothetical protein
MTPQFITLPSGLRVNTAHILEYRQDRDDPKRVRIWQAISDGAEGHATFIEDMTAEQLDALLNPPSSPIVESVVNLANFKKGGSCQFTYGSEKRHGVIEEIGVFSGTVFVQFSSHGQTFRYFPQEGYFTIVN